MHNDILFNIKLVNNIYKKRLELPYQEEVAYAEYIIDNETILLINTHIPESLHLIEGLGKEFISKIKQYSSDNGLILKAICPYANALLKTH